MLEGHRRPITVSRTTRRGLLSQVFGVAVDGAGDLLILDVGNGRIRMVAG